MKRRRLDQPVRLTLPARPVTRTVTPRQVEDYLRANRWQIRNDGSGAVPDARDRTIPLSRVIAKIALHEGRWPGEVLADIAAGRGRIRALRSSKTWPT